MRQQALGAGHVRRALPAAYLCNILHSYSYADGSKYEGYWREDCRNGRCAPAAQSETETEFKSSRRGVYKWMSGDRYEGEWQHELMDGEGVYTHGYSGSSQTKGGVALRWAAGGFAKRNPKPAVMMRSGDQYDGSFKEDQRHGTGVLRKRDGEVCESVWVRGTCVQVSADGAAAAAAADDDDDDADDADAGD